MINFARESGEVEGGRGGDVGTGGGRCVDGQRAVGAVAVVADNDLPGQSVAEGAAGRG